jgi:hypothetical protein
VSMDNSYTRFNERLAAKISDAVGTMTTAYTFGVLAFIGGFPGLLPDTAQKYALWCSTVFLQLVLLSILGASTKRNGAAVGDIHAAVAEEHTKAHRFRELLRTHHDLPKPE